VSESQTAAGQSSAVPGFLAVEHVSMWFTGRAGGRAEPMCVLDDVSLVVEEGEFVCLIGPSGCGKSTLLRIVDGLLLPTQGTIRIQGQVTRAPRRDIGVVFQSFNLLPWRTVLDNVRLGLEHQGVPRRVRQERAHRWLDVVGLTGFEHFYPAQLSGGMQQRVGLARALAVEPQILLMDEPFGSLDAQTRLLMQEELLRLWTVDRRTVVFVTHDVEEALFLADRVIVLSHRPGRLIESVRVPFSRPRLDALRGQADFARLKELLWQRLKSDLTKLASGDDTTLDVSSRQ